MSSPKKTFCHNCGAQQASVYAKFCSACGTSLQSLQSKPEPVPQSLPPPYMVGGRDDDDEDIDHIDKLDIRINKLEVEIVKDRPNTETLGALAHSPLAASPEETRVRNATPMRTEDVLEEFKKEAGAIRPNR